MAGFVGFILGTVLGSFSLALAHRSLSKKSFSGRSYCPACKHKLYWYDLIPVVSYTLLKGKCRYCGDKIGIEYMVVELVMGILIGFLFWQNSANFSAIGGPAYGWQFSIFISDLLLKIFFICILVALFLTDLKKMLIPDRIVIPAIWISITFITVITIIKIIFLYFYLTQTLLGRKLLEQTDYLQRHALITAEPLLGSILMAISIGGFFWGLIIITKGKGMGGGDVKLGVFLGIMLGFPNALVAIFLAFVIGAVWAVGAIILGKKSLKQTIAFGPFLVLGSLIALFWGNQILSLYLTIN